jgi:hypothetical protein
MKRAPKTFFILLALLCFAGLLKATLPQTSIGKWTSAVAFSEGRSNAPAVRLSDGRILITGGNGVIGPLQTTEFFGTNGTVASAAAMNVARSSHFAVVLSDGRVLVGGGVSGGGTTNSAEIYDPAADSWTKTNAMTEARANATAALLADGRVLIAGGDNSGNASNTIELFDPSNGSFSFAGTLSAARTKHAMATLEDGRVLIVGGFDGTNPLASSDIFDPSSGNISAGPSLATARYSASATTLLNGQVAVIGGAGSDGNGGTTDLASVEIFDASTGAFTTAGAVLATAREAHQAYLLPKNNSVLIVGGTSSGSPVAASELFTPQASPSNGAWTYAITSTGSNVTPRSAASGTAMQQDGLLLALGGTDASGNSLASTELYAFPTVKTDAADYPPGTTVNISGHGFQPGENVTITLVESPLFDTHGPYTVTADANGNFSDSSFTTDAHDVDIRFWLSAVGTQSGLVAQNTFKDGNATSVSGTVKSSATGNPAIVGATITCTSGCNNSPAATTTSGTGGAYVFDNTTTKLSFGTNGPVTLQLTASATGFISQTITLTGVNTGDTLTGKNFTLTPAVVGTTTTIASAPNPSVYGSSVTFTATVTRTSGSNTPSGTVAIKEGTTTLCTAGSLSGTGATATASCLVASLSVAGSPHTINAVYGGDTNFTGSTSTTPVSQTVTAKALTVTGVTVQDHVYDGTKNATLNVTGATLVGVVTGDTVTLDSSSYTALFASKDVGTGVAVTVTGLKLAGAQSGNYTLTQPSNLTGSITARPITVTAATNIKVYDGTTTATATPTVTTGSLATGDTASFTEVYANKKVGTGLTLIPSGTVSDGNTGNNYAVTFVNNTTGVITARPITVTAATNSKPYDGTTTAAATPTITTGSLAAGDTASFTEVYANKNVGTGLTLIPSGTVSDGNSGNNYAVTFVNNTTGVITARAITVTAVTNSKQYDGTTSAAGVPTITSGTLVGGDTPNFTEAYISKNVGTGLTLVPTGSVSDGNNGNNYAVTFVNNTTGVITARAITVTAATNSKPYDGTISAAGVSTITSGTLVGGDTTRFTETYTSKNVGTGLTLVPTGSVNDGNSGNNYAVTFVNNNTGVIMARAITVTAVTDTRVYNGTAVSAGIPTITSGTLATGDTAAFTQAFDNKDAGARTLTPSGTMSDGNGGNNYAATFIGVNGSITPVSITLSVTGAAGVYNAMPFQATCNVHSGLIGSDTVTVTVSYTAGMTPVLVPISAGSYTATCTSSGNSNYNPAVAQAAVTISPATLTVAADNQSMTFGGIAPTFTAQFAGFQGQDDKTVVSGLTFTVLDNTNTPVTDFTTLKAGSYSIVPSGAGAINYIFQYVNGTLTVNKATFTGTVTTTAADPNTVAYGQPLTATVNLNSYSIGGVPVLQKHADPSDPNGPQLPESLTVYLVPQNGNPSQAVKFGTATAVPTYDHTNHTTGTEKTGWIATITAPAPTPGNYTAFVYGDDPGDQSLSGLNPSLADAGYFYPDTSDINYPILQSTQIDVVQATVTLTFTAADKTYDGNKTAAVSNCAIAGGRIGNDDVTCTVSNGLFATKSAASQTVTATATLAGANAANYTVTNPVTTNATINQAPLTITGIAANSRLYDGTTAASLSGIAVLNGVVSGDYVTLNTAGVSANFATKNVGTAKPVSVGGYTITGTDSGNYSLAQPTGLSADITQAPLSVIGVTAKNKVYDGTAIATLYGTASLSGVISSDTVNLSTAGVTATFDTKNVGAAKPISVTGYSISGGDTPNYLLAQPAGLKADINPATLTYTANPATRSYGATDPAFSGTVGGFITGENQGNATTGTLVFTTTADAHSNVGAYPISGSGLTANYGNYVFVQAASNATALTITKADATVVVTPYTVTYDGNSHTATVTSITGANGETGATVGVVNVNNTTHTAAGTYSTDSWSFAGAANYKDIAATTITDTIYKATATVVVTPYTVTYDGNAHTATVTSIIGVNGETGTAVGVVTLNTTHTDAGTYNTDSWSFAGAANYKDIAATTITDTIYKAPVTATGGSYNGTYDGSTHSPSACAVTGTYKGDLSCVNNPALVGPNASSGAVAPVVSGTGLMNFAVTSVNGAFTITKANATIGVTPYNVAYNGAAHTATGTAKGVQGESLIGLSLSGTTHTNPGDYLSDPWAFTDVTGNYNNASGSVHDSIGYGACSVGPGGVILPPINSDGTSVYQRKGGSTIPVKFNVCGANGAPLTDPTLVFAGTGGALTMTGTMRGTITTVNESTDNAIPDAAFTWDGQQWHFNMATMNLTSGYTYTFKINLAYSPQSITFVVGVK